MRIAQLIAAASSALIFVGASTSTASAIELTSVNAGIHVVEKSSGISFYAPSGYVRVRGVAGYILVELRDDSTSAQLTVESAGGDVTIADAKAYLKSWVGKDHLKIDQARTVYERFGEVADLRFTFTFPGSDFTEYGEELRFQSGARSFDVIVDSWVAPAVKTTAQQLLATWGH